MSAGRVIVTAIRKREHFLVKKMIYGALSMHSVGGTTAMHSGLYELPSLEKLVSLIYVMSECGKKLLVDHEIIQKYVNANVQG